MATRRPVASVGGTLTEIPDTDTLPSALLLRVRASAAATTSSLAPAAVDSTTTITLGKSFRLYSIQTSRPARVRLYATAAALAADASRGIGTDPNSDAGVILDYVTADTSVHTLSPLVDGANLESSVSASISMSVTNQDVSTGTITVTFNTLREE